MLLQWDHKGLGQSFHIRLFLMLMINKMQVHFVGGVLGIFAYFFLGVSLQSLCHRCLPEERALHVHTAALEGVILTNFALSMC